MIDFAVELSLKKLPPKKPAGEPLKIKKRKEMLSQLRLIVDSLDGIWLAKSIRSEALAQLVQCQADGIDVDPQTRAIVFPPSPITFPTPFKPID